MGGWCVGCCRGGVCRVGCGAVVLGVGDRV